MKIWDDYLAEAKARGASLVDDSQPGSGFEDDVTDDPMLDTPEVRDAQKRMEDASLKPASQIDELTKQMLAANQGNVRKYKFLFQEEYEEAAWDRGRVLWMGDFLQMLQTMRPDAFLAEYSYLGLRGLGFIINGVPEYSGVALMNANSPEWSLLRVDAHGLPKNERFRGWRTVLLTLIRKQIITEDQCYAVFGKPHGPRSRPWWRALFAMRNSLCPECRKEICICADHYDYMRADAYQYAVPAEISSGRRQEAMPQPDGSIWMPN